MSEHPIKLSNNLEERSLRFAKSIRLLIKMLPKTLSNIEDLRQLIRSSGSVGANYIEANECLGRNDFLHKIRIARKEAKESLYWLQLIEASNNEQQMAIKNNAQEAQELRSILSSILIKSERK